MPRRLTRMLFLTCLLGLVLAGGPVVLSGSGAPQGKAAPPQKIDAEYTAKIKEYTQDPRILTELVDHLPASATVPSPLKFLGRIAGTPDELTYYKDIAALLRGARQGGAGRVEALVTIGKSEEGRDMIVMAIADEATIKTLDKYKKILADLTDPRKLTEAQAQAAHRRRQADLLGDRQPALGRDRQRRDADGAGLPAGRRGDAVHPEHPQQRDRLPHAGASRWTAARRWWTTSTTRRRPASGCR